MGNQREIRQVSPRAGLGVVIPIRERCSTDVLRVLGERDDWGRYYVYFCPSGEAIECTNMDGALDENIFVEAQSRDHIVIQSGGKMWCGYDAFVERIRALAPNVEDALFYVGDEVDYIDEFRISDGVLQYRRVLEGFWYPVDRYIEEINSEVGNKPFT